MHRGVGRADVGLRIDGAIDDRDLGTGGPVFRGAMFDPLPPAPVPVTVALICGVSVTPARPISVFIGGGVAEPLYEGLCAFGRSTTSPPFVARPSGRVNFDDNLAQTNRG